MLVHSGEKHMATSDTMTEERIRDFLNELKKRRPDTKLRLLRTMVKMGPGWHSLKEISESAIEGGVKIPHIWENMIELSRMSGFMKSDYAEKRFPRFAGFRVEDNCLPLIEKVLQNFDTE